MRQTFREADFNALAALWNDFYPAKYRIDPFLLKQNTVDSPVFDWGASSIEVDEGVLRGFVAVKRSPNPTLYPGSGSDQAHLSAIAFADPQTAVDLLADAKLVLRNRGVQTVRFGEDTRHFFPGCPCDSGALCDFLMVEGFDRGEEIFDFERDLSTYKPVADAPAGVSFRPLKAGDANELSALLGREFSPRWQYDVMAKIEIEGPECVYCAVEGDKLVGFALIQDWKNKLPISGAVWRNALGEKWGALGPIGVVKAKRGKGIGHALLSAALEHQKKKGVKRCIIDWSVLKDFYGKHGFEVTRTYRSSSLRLAD